ncbi:uncharacterized protein LOC119548278 [Drosophila subpulchrella]|uniref:uncharacterized protein LOC119548278 n=1 Tax=Drosophila subpulchrella TaxID=1486046 RepID=UPI0018A1749E|nr:uncharacterized protein LOC119548278 [Drosophila subpulchrella]
MSSKRKLTFPLEVDDHQNNPDREAPRIKQLLTSNDLNAPRADKKSASVKAAVPRPRSTLSRFDSSWLALQKTEITRSQPDAPGNTSVLSCSQLLNTSWPATKRRAKALPLVVQKSSRTPTVVTNMELKVTSSFHTPGKTAKDLNSPIVNGRNLLVESASCHRRNNPKVFDLTWQAMKKTATCSQQDSKENTSLSSCSQHLNASWSESSPVIKLVPEESPKQYLPITPKVNLKLNQRFLRGSYADDFRRFLKNVRMDQRHIKDRVATHTIKVLAISEECGLSIALVAPERGGSNFNILLQKKQSGLIKVGSRLQFYLEPNTKPIRLQNQQLVYCRPHNLNVL